MPDSQGRLFVISGPSGVGKGTICNGLLLRRDIDISVSMTTRAPRPDEIDGKSYYFVTHEAFRELIAKNAFYEYAEVHGEFYGTPMAPVLEKLAAGRDVILEIDPQGALQIKESCPDCIMIFILPPSFAELRRRIEGRGSESPEKIERRMETAKSEIGTISKYDYCVVNRELDVAIDDVEAIVISEHIRPEDRDAAELSLRAKSLRISENSELLAEWLTAVWNINN